MEENILEQPQKELNEQGKGILQNKNEEEFGQNLNGFDGSKLGKFKDAESLLSAYNSLQSDYTKKCQALASLQKELKDNESKISPVEDKQNDNEENNSQNNIPLKDGGKGKENGDLFEDAVRKALNKITPKKSESELSTENYDLLQEFIFSTPQLKDSIVQRYFSELKIPSSPKLMGEDKGASVILAPISKPKTLQDAEKAVIQLFSKD